MKQYELVTIFYSDMPEEEMDKILGDAHKAITTQKGEILDTDKWGKRELATQFKKQKTGYYVITSFSADNNVLEKLNQFLKVNEKIVKYMVAQKTEIPEPEEKAN